MVVVIIHCVSYRISTCLSYGVEYVYDHDRVGDGGVFSLLASDSVSDSTFVFSGTPVLLGVGVKEDLYSSSEILISRKMFLASADNRSYGVFQNFLTFLLVGVTSSTVSPKPCVCATPKSSSAFSTVH